MNLHDFVAEPVNPEHIFHDAHTVSFCPTDDQPHHDVSHVPLPASSQHSFGLPLDTCCVENVRYQ